MQVSSNIYDYVVNIPDDPSIKELHDILIVLQNRFPTAIYNYKISVNLYKKYEDILEIKKQKQFRDIDAQDHGKKNLTITEKKMIAVEQLEEDYNKLDEIRGKMLLWEAIVTSLEEQINICKKILSFSETEYKNASNM